MSGYCQFMIAMVVMLSAWLLWSLRGENIINYFKTKTGLGILKGIVIVLVVMTSVAMAKCAYAGDFFASGSIYAGLDYTFKQSPQCQSNGPDSHSTSNVGARINIYQSSDKTFRFNTKYTHHSCGFNSDRNTYDAIGGELELRLW